jgi:hypothetical protein
LYIANMTPAMAASAEPRMKVNAMILFDRNADEAGHELVLRRGAQGDAEPRVVDEVKDRAMMTRVRPRMVICR